jgi:peptide/nickel transport system permease protein
MEWKMIFHRVASAIFTMFLSSMVIFVLVRFAPGDPIDLIMGQMPRDTGINMEMLEGKKAELREQQGLNASIPVQYFIWAKKVITLDFGTSIKSGRPIITELAERVPATLLLSSAAMFFEVVLGLLFGLYSAIKANCYQDSIVRIICVVFASLPGFILSLLLLYIFSVHWCYYDLSSTAEQGRLWLPALTLGLVGAPQIIRMIRATMLTELGQTYVVAALSRGVSTWRILQGAFRNALLPIITTVALSFAHLVGGSVVIESIFNWPGLGNYAMNSLLFHDYPAIQGYTVLTVTTVIIINLLVELTYLLADPRLRRAQRVSLEKEKGEEICMGN